MVNGLYNNYKITAKKNVLFLFSIIFLCAITFFTGIGFVLSANKEDLECKTIVEAENNNEYEDEEVYENSEEIIDPERKNFPQIFLVSVYYDENGGTDVSDLIDIQSEFTSQATFPSTEKDGFLFDGWYESESNNNGSGVKAGETGEYLPYLTISKHYYARWVSKIEFDSNGGTTCSTIYAGYNSPIILPSPTKALNGFLGWYLSESGNQGSGTKAGDGGESYDVSGGSDKLYAKWGYLVTFNENGGDPVSDVEVQNAQNIILPTIIRNNYDFVNWKDEDFVTYMPLSSVIITKNMTFSASWSADITFDENGGSDVDDVTVNEGESVSLPSTTRLGYDFVGWSTSESNNNGTSEDLVSSYTESSGHDTLYARWEATIEFDSNDGNSVSSIIAEPGEVVVLQNTTRGTYTFKGWCTSGNVNGTEGAEVSTNYTVTGNTTLYARWEATVVFDSNDGDAVGSVTVEPNDVITLPDITRGTYTFKGWCTSGNVNGTEGAEVSTNYTVTGNTILYARWEATVVFDSNDGDAVGSVTVEPNDVITLPDITRGTYTFESWCTSGNVNGTEGAEVSTNYTVTGNTTLYARWTATITLDENGGEDVDDIVAEPGDSLTFETTLMVGYTFKDWCSSESNNNGTEGTEISGYIVTGADTIYARWTTIIYFDPNNGDSDIQITAEPNENLTLPVVTKTGYYFDSWCTAEDNNNGTDATAVSSYTVSGTDFLYARWNVKITFDSNFGEAVSSMYASIDEVITLPTTTRSSRVFAGWSTVELNNNGTKATLVPTNYVVVGEITLCARWLVTISFDSNFGDGVNDVYAAVDEEINLLDSTRLGYVFAGWSTVESDENGTSATLVSNPYTVVNNITLHARWLVTISFDSNFGETVSDVYAEIGDYIALTEISRANYDYDGWSTAEFNNNGTEATSIGIVSYNVTGNATLYARWTAIITFDFNSEDPTSDVVVGYNDTLTLPSGIEKTGHTFLGWSTEEIDDNGTEINLVSNYTAELGHDTLYARWGVNSYNLTFYGNTETGGNTPLQTLVYNTPTKLNSNGFYKTGYHFVGWSEHNVTVDEDIVDALEIDYADGEDFTILDADDELYAVWEIDFYTVTLHQRDGNNWTDSVLNGTVRYGHTLLDEGLTLISPVLSQNTFIEWTTINWATEATNVNSTFTVDSVVTSDMDIYTAFWEGKGTESSYIEIATLVDFTLFKEYVNNENEYSTANWSQGKYVSQTADLDFTSTADIGKVGTSTSMFEGTYYGNYHTILNYEITDGSDYTGLFGYVNSALIEDLYLEDFTVSGGTYVGGLIGRADNSVVYNVGIMSGSTVTASSHLVGALVGLSVGSSFTQCFNNTATVSATHAVGGLIGVSWSNTIISRCFNKGSVEATTGGKIGGLIGEATGVTITQSYAICDLTSNSTTNYVGGLAGTLLNSTIKESYAICNLISSGVTDSYVGGIAGSESGTIELNRCYWNLGDATYAVASTSSNIGATEKTTTLLKDKDTYLAWNFNNDWYIYSSINSSYPVLRINDTIKVNVINGTSVYGTSIDVGYNSTTNLIFEPATGYKLNKIEGQVSSDITDSTEIENIIINGYDYSYSGLEKMLGEGVYYSQIGDTITVTFSPFTISWKDVADLSSADGDGSSSDPYLISSAEELAGLDGIIGDAWLVANIDLSGRIWEPISFTGTFNGNGYAIYDMYVNTTDAGLFTTINGTVKNLTINTSAVYGTNSGMIAYSLNGDITDSYVEGLVFGSVAGGLVYKVSDGSTIERSYNSARVIGDLTAGGLIATSESLSVTDVYNTGQIECLNGTTLGGLIGETLDTVTITNAYNAGEILGNSGSSLVGISNATITITNGYYLEGMSDLTGAIGTINSSYSVNGNSDNFVGVQTSSDMILEATYSGFSFDSTPLTYSNSSPWALDDFNTNNGYPTLIGVNNVVIIGNSPTNGTNEVSAGKYEDGQINSYAITLTPSAGYAISSITVNGLDIAIADMIINTTDKSAIVEVGLAGAIQTVDVVFVALSTITFYETNDGINWTVYSTISIPTGQSVTLNSTDSSMVLDITTTHLGAGYTFVKWVTTENGETVFSEDTIITGDTSIYAWIEVSITFDLNGGNISGSEDAVTQYVRLNQAFTYSSDTGVYPTNPEKVGYNFSEWNTLDTGEGNTFTSSTIVDGVKVLTAVWEPKTNISYSFVDYIDGVETDELVYKDGQDYVVTYDLTVDNSVDLSAPEVWGYELDSWELKSGEAFGIISGNTYTIAPEDENGFVLIANYVAKTGITIDFTSNIDTIDSSEYNSYIGNNTIDEEITLITPIVEGYTFDGWEIVVGTSTDNNADINSDNKYYFYPADEGGVTIKASFTPKVVTVSFTYNPSENTVNPEMVEITAEVGEEITLTAGIMQGYNLDHWEVVRSGDNDVLASNTYTILPSDETGVTMKAIYIAKTGIAISFSTKPASLTNTGSDDWKITEGINTVGEEIMFSYPNDADIVGYDFDHWEIVRTGDNYILPGNTYIILPKDEDGIEVLAVYAPQVVTITFETSVAGLSFRNDAVLTYTGTNEVESTIALVAPNDSDVVGFTFDNWELKTGEAYGTLTGSNYTIVPEDENGVTIIGNYVEKTGITVTFTTGPVSNLAVPTFTGLNNVNSTITLSTPSAVEGYEFSYWTVITGNNTMEVDGISYTIAPEDDGGVEFQAVYEPKDVTVTFEYNPSGKNVTQEASVSGLQVTGEEITFIPAEIEGYTFDYWEIVRIGDNDVLAGNTYTPVESDDGNLTIIGNYVANEVTVTFVSYPSLAGTSLGISGGVTPVVDGTVTFIQTVSNATYYNFSGWTSADSYNSLTGLNGNTYTLTAEDYTNGGITIQANYEVLVEFELSGENGTGSIDTANGFFFPNSSQTFTATASGYSCIDWTVEEWNGSAWVDTSSDIYGNPVTVTISDTPTKYIANMQEKTISVQVSPDNSSRGSASGTGFYVISDLVSIDTIAYSAYKFDYWEVYNGTTLLTSTDLAGTGLDTFISTSSAVNYTLTGADIDEIYNNFDDQKLILKAIFDYQEITIDTQTSTGGTIIDSDGSYILTDTLSLFATADASLGYVFNAWTFEDKDGNVLSSSYLSLVNTESTSYSFTEANIGNIYNLTDATLIVKATFTREETLVTFTSYPSSAANSMSYTGFSYVGNTITLTQSANTNYEFDYWEVILGTNSISGVSLDEYVVHSNDYANAEIGFVAHYKVYVESTNDGDGSLDLVDGYYSPADTIEITSTANAGKYLLNIEIQTWDQISWVFASTTTDNPYTLTVPTVPVRLVANYSDKEYNVSTTVNMENGEAFARGSVTGSTGVVDGTEITIEATAYSGYQFSHWTGLDVLENYNSINVNNYSITYTITAIDIETIETLTAQTLEATAYFIKTQVVIECTANTGGSVTALAVSVYEEGDSFTLTATADSSLGYVFNGWSLLDNGSDVGDLSGTALAVFDVSLNPASHTLTSADVAFIDILTAGTLTFRAEFVKQNVTINFDSNASLASSVGAWSSADSTSYVGDTITLSQTFDATYDYSFNRWEVVEGTANGITGLSLDEYLITADDFLRGYVTVKAIYDVWVEFDTLYDGGVGTVDLANGYHEIGTTIIAIASATGYSFNKWEEYTFDGSDWVYVKESSLNPYEITVDDVQNKYVAQFMPQTVYISVISDDLSKGTVTGSASLNSDDSNLTISATALTGYRLYSWTGLDILEGLGIDFTATDTSISYYLTLNDINAIVNDESLVNDTLILNAQFVSLDVSVNIVSENTGLGTVTEVSGNYNVGDSISLIALANDSAGYEFDYWQVEDITLENTFVDSAITTYSTLTETDIQTIYDLNGTHTLTITAHFRLKIYRVYSNIQRGVGGTLVASDAEEEVTYGGDITYTITPSSGYWITGLVINSVSVIDDAGCSVQKFAKSGSPQIYTFTGVSEEPSIEVIFTKYYAVSFYTITSNSEIYSDTGIYYEVSDDSTLNNMLLDTKYQDLFGISEMPVVTNAGGTFEGWSDNTTDNDSNFTNKTTVTYDITVYAVFKSTVMFDGNGSNETPVALNDLRIGNEITLPVLTKTGYSFDYWLRGDGVTQVSVLDTAINTGNETLTAYWLQNFTLTCYIPSLTATWTSGIPSAWEEYATIVVTDGYSITTDTDADFPAEPIDNSVYLSEDGYSFELWYSQLNVTAFTANTVVTEDMNLYAGIQATVSFDLYGGTSTEEDDRHTLLGSEIGTLPSVTKTDATLRWWRNELSEQVDASYIITKPQTVSAVWLGNETTLTVKAVTNGKIFTEDDPHNGNGGNVKINSGTSGTVSSETVNLFQTLGTSGTEIVISASISETDYEFLGWYEDINFERIVDFDGLTLEEEDMTLYARFEGVEKTLTVMSVTNDEISGLAGDIQINGDISSDVVYQSVAYGENVVLRVVNVNSSYNFVGWFTEVDGGTQIGLDTQTTFEMNMEQSQTIYARFIGVDCEVTVEVYPSLAGTTVGAGTFAYGTNVTLSWESNFEGYEFYGWKVKGSNNNTVIKTTSYTIESINEVLITYVALFKVEMNFGITGQGSIISTYAGQSSRITLENEESVFTVLYLPDATLTLTPDADTGYSLSSEENKGWNIDPVNNELTPDADGVITGKVPTKPTTFSVIFELASFNVTANMIIAEMAEGQTDTNVGVVYVSNAETEGTYGATSILSGLYNSTLSLNAVNYTGYVFAGWFTNYSCTIPYSPDNITSVVVTANESDNIYYAKFEALEYTLTYDENFGEDKGNSELEDVNGFYGTQVYSLPIPVRMGYNFLGWYDSEELVVISGSEYQNNGTGTLIADDAGVLIDGAVFMDSDITYYAKWESKETEIILNFHENSPNNGYLSIVGIETTGEVGDEIIIEIIVDSGYEFVTWSEDVSNLSLSGDYNNIVRATYTVEAVDADTVQTIIYATIREKEVDVYISNNFGGNVSGSSSNTYYKVGDVLTLTCSPATEYGYYFAGWTQEGLNETSWTTAGIANEQTTTYTLTATDIEDGYLNGKIIIRANFEIETFTVTFIYAGGKEEGNISASQLVLEGENAVNFGTYGKELTPPTLTKTAYEFKGWLLMDIDNANYDYHEPLYNVRIYEDVTFIASWQVQTYTIEVEIIGFGIVKIIKDSNDGVGSIEYNDDVTCYIIADEDYITSGIYLDDEYLTAEEFERALEEGIFLEKITEDHEIEVTFSRDLTDVITVATILTALVGLLLGVQSLITNKRDKELETQTALEATRGNRYNPKPKKENTKAVVLSRHSQRVEQANRLGSIPKYKFKSIQEKVVLDAKTKATKERLKREIQREKLNIKNKKDPKK